MNQLTRRSMLGRSSGLVGAAATMLPLGLASAQVKAPEPDRKLRVVAVGGHPDDPESCAGGTLTLFADQGHEVTGLALCGGPPPPPDPHPADGRGTERRNAMKWAEVLKIRLDCLNYKGSNSGQSKLPIVYGSASEISGQRYKEFTEILLDKYNPDLVITHWPIDFHMDHRAASLLTYSAWLTSGKKFALYYMEAEIGGQTQNFYPTHYVDITSVEERTHEGWKTDMTVYPDIWPLHDMMRRFRGAEHGCKVAEAFNHHPQSPTFPPLP